MKRLAVFCDGTWNDLRMPERTNVARLAKCVADTAPNGVQQVVYYDTGVGVSAGISRLVDWATGIAGGAFGQGLDEKIEDAYRFLVLNYEVGDEIYIFGFSRGAYTARSLCGLIRKCGIVRRNCFDMIPQAVALYRNQARPEDVAGFRQQYAQRSAAGLAVAAGWEDLPEEQRQQWGRRHGSSAERSEKEQADDATPIYRLMFLGVWDTVGALGIPPKFRLLAGLLNRRYRFHDTNASSLITHLRHAVSVDEDRWAFDVTPVSNIEALNRDWAGSTGAEVDDALAPNYVPYEQRPYQQRWFPGDHGAVGGGNPEPGLSSGTLLWMAEGAFRAGLALKVDPGNELNDAMLHATPLAEWRIRKDGQPRAPWEFDGLGLAAGYRDRRGPLTFDELHENTVSRYEARPEYRPRPLERFTGKVQPTPAYRTAAAIVRPFLYLAVIVAAALVAGLVALALLALVDRLRSLRP